MTRQRRRSAVGEDLNQEMTGRKPERITDQRRRSAVGEDLNASAVTDTLSASASADGPPSARISTGVCAALPWRVSAQRRRSAVGEDLNNCGYRGRGTCLGPAPTVRRRRGSQRARRAPSGW